MVDFALTDENRLVQQSVRDFAEAEILPHIREWDEKGEVHREVFARMGELGFLGAPIPEALRRLGHGLHQLRAAVRGARACRHRVPCRPERPRRAQLADAPPVGHRGAEASAGSCPQAKGEKLATFGLTEPGVGTDAANLATTARRDGDVVPSSTARRSGSASPTSPTTSWSSPPSTARRAGGASPRSSSSAGWTACRPARSTASSASAPATPG